MCTNKSSSWSADWLEDLTPFIYISNMHLLSTMASERKAGKAMETATSNVSEEKTPPLSPQSVGRKLPRAANRELAGWELDCQAKVSKGLTS